MKRSIIDRLSRTSSRLVSTNAWLRSISSRDEATRSAALRVISKTEEPTSQCLRSHRLCSLSYITCAAVATAWKAQQNAPETFNSHELGETGALEPSRCGLVQICQNLPRITSVDLCGFDRCIDRPTPTCATRVLLSTKSGAGSVSLRSLSSGRPTAIRRSVSASAALTGASARVHRGIVPTTVCGGDGLLRSSRTCESLSSSGAHVPSGLAERGGACLSPLDAQGPRRGLTRRLSFAAQERFPVAE